MVSTVQPAAKGAARRMGRFGSFSRHGPTHPDRHTAISATVAFGNFQRFIVVLLIHDLVSSSHSLDLRAIACPPKADFDSQRAQSTFCRQVLTGRLPRLRPPERHLAPTFQRILSLAMKSCL